MQISSVRPSYLPLILLLALRGTAVAQAPLGAEFRVNAKTELTQDTQRLAVARDGSFAVTWVDAQGQISPYKPVVAIRFFDSKGNPLGRELYPASDPGWFPFVMARPISGFRILWGGPKDGRGYLFLQNYLSGAPDGGLIAVPAPDSSMYITNAVSTSRDRIVLSWLTNPIDPPFEVKMIRLAPRGQSYGEEMTAGVDPENPMFIGDVGVDFKGNAVVVWAGECGPYGEGKCDALAQRYSASGTRLGEQIRVNTTTKGLQEFSQVAVSPQGGFLVAWHNLPNFPDRNPADVFAQRFSASGQKLGREFRVNTSTGFPQVYPAVSADPFGNYLVVWLRLEPEQGIYGWNLYGQLLRNDGRRVGKEFKVNTRNTFNELPQARVAFAGNGTFVAVWNADDGDFDGVYGQRFMASPGAEACFLREGQFLCDTGRTGGEAELQVTLAGEKVIFGDADGDGRKDPCVFSNGIFRCDTDKRGEPFEAEVRFGREGDAPFFGDVDGDGREEPCVRRGRFHLCDTAHNGGRPEASFGIGSTADVPLLGDIDGDGRDDACVFEPGGRFLCDTRHNGGEDLAIRFGQPGDVPLLGNFDGDGDDDPCVFRSGVFLCDTAHDGGEAEMELAFGQAGDRPLLGNLDGL